MSHLKKRASSKRNLKTRLQTKTKSKRTKRQLRKTKRTTHHLKKTKRRRMKQMKQIKQKHCGKRCGGNFNKRQIDEIENLLWDKGFSEEEIVGLIVIINDASQQISKGDQYERFYIFLNESDTKQEITDWVNTHGRRLADNGETDTEDEDEDTDEEEEDENNH
jgi:hypothetical protein